MNEIPFTKDDRFEVGGEDLLAPIQFESVSSTSQPLENAADRRCPAIVDDIRVRLSTLLKTETVSLLLGAGASVDCGGQLIGTVPLLVERLLINEGITGEQNFRIRRWLAVFYLAVRHASCGAETPITRQEILDRQSKIENGQAEPLQANFEQVLSKLQRWRSALPDVGGRLRVDGQPRVDATGQDLEACLGYATHSLARACDLPTSDKEASIEHYKNLVRKLLTRPLNLKRVNIFKLNYDTLINVHENGVTSEPLQANFEQVLSKLQRWRSALPDVGGRLRVDGQPRVDATGQDLEACLGYATHSLARACDLPTSDKEASIEHYKNLVRKLLTRPLNLKRVNIFKLNYDTLIEQAADAAGVVLLDGFVGTQRRVFRPESYEQDLYFPAETTEGRVHRFDRVLHLYKLHGSITWVADESQIDNPYGVRSSTFNPHETQPLLIYPMPTKYGETLGIPYSELFRRFASALVRPQSVLVAIGYGFGDEHVNAIIRQALAIPSFTLVVVDPCPNNLFITKLRKQKDRRIWLAQGPTIGTFAGFVDWILPDLRDEEIRMKVLATHNALARLEQTNKGLPCGD